MYCSKSRFYSITSSARASMACGIARPSDLAVLITNSNLIGVWPGSSFGFAHGRAIDTLKQALTGAKVARSFSDVVVEGDRPAISSGIPVQRIGRAAIKCN